MDLLQKLLAFAATTLGVATTEVEEQLENSEDATPILDLHKKKVKEAKDKNFDDGYKKAERKVLSDREKELKEEFGVESDKIGIELIREILEVKSSATLPELTEEAVKAHPLYKSKEVPDDLVKKHPLFIKKENEAQQIKEKTEKEWQEKLDTIQAGHAKKETFKTVAERALAEFEKLNPILSPDPVKAARQKEIFIKELEANAYEVQGDDILVLEADGRKKEDDFGNTYKFSDLVRSAADKYFDFKVATDRDSAGNIGRLPAPTGKKFQGKLPTSEPEYTKIMNDQTIPVEQRQEVQDHWKKQTSNV